MKVSIKYLLLLALLSVTLFSTVKTQDEDELEDELLDEEEHEEEDIPLPAEEEAPPEPVERPVCVPPVAKGNAFFAEAFESVSDFEKRWVKSKATKDEDDVELAKYDGKWSVEEPKDNPLQGDLGLVLKSRAKHHAVSAKLDTPFDFTSLPFVVQYEVKFQNGQECGGAYIKLLSEDKNFDLSQFYDKTPYTIMFGPDKCGNDNKLHFIFRHHNPKTGLYEEKHAKKPTGAIDTFFTDKKTHLFTLVVNSDNSFEIYVDQNLVNRGNLLEDVEPPVNPAKEIVDPEDKKPKDWDEREKIPDPDAEKPDDWDESQPEMITDPDAVKPDGWLDDEPELIPDPDAEKPSDWDEDMDGEWEAPMISNPACESASGCGEWVPAQIKNPAYKGKWKAPMIENPNYKGKWKPRKIANPDFFEDLEPYKMTPIGAVGLELWSMSDDIYFDNFIITDDKSVADQYAADSWELKNEQELRSSSGKSVVQAVLDATNERPWLWAVFILVVVLPIVLVIAYCCRSGSKGGIIQSLLSAADQMKWLYAVYAVVLLLPVLILSFICCPNKGPVKPEDIARHKKTDEPSPDDEVQEEDVEETEEKEEEKEEEDKGAGGDGDSSKAKKSSKGALEAEDDNEADAEDEEEVDKEETRSSPRRRKNKPQKE